MPEHGELVMEDFDPKEVALTNILVAIMATALLILGIIGCCATFAHAQQGPQAASYYRQNGPVPVRIYDGGTGAREAYTARRNLGIIAANLTGLRDSLSVQWYSALMLPIIRVKDNQLWVMDDGDTTKKVVLQLSGLTTATTRTDTIPDLSGRVLVTAGWGTRDSVLTSNGPSSPPTWRAAAGASFDPLVSHSWSGSQDFSGSGRWYVTPDFGSYFESYQDMTSDDTQFIRINDGGIGGWVDIKGPAGNVGIANINTQRFQDASGVLPLIGAEVNATAQTADIASTDTGVLAGRFYRVNYSLCTTTADALAGTATVTFTYTDDVGSTSTAATALTLTLTGKRTGSFVTYLASGTLNYAVSHTGSFGSAQYALRVRVDTLN
jgi:hypothetical protein